jgi:hypothetical protein
MCDIDAAFVHARAGCDVQSADCMGALARCYMLQHEPLSDDLMDRVVEMAAESAAAGSATGCTVLGCMLAKGWHTVRMDVAAAAAAFLRSASAPHPCADGAYRYSICCALGLGVPRRDRIWLRRAAPQKRAYVAPFLPRFFAARA